MAFKGKCCFKEKPKSLRDTFQSWLTPCHSKSRILMAWSRMQELNLQVRLPKPKGKPVWITKNPRRSFSRSLPKPGPPGEGPLKQGQATSPVHGSTESAHLSCSCRRQAELMVLHTVSCNDKGYQNYMDSQVFHWTYKCSVSLPRVIQITQPSRVCEPELQVSMRKGIYKKTAGASDCDKILKQRSNECIAHFWTPGYVWPGSSGHVWFLLTPLSQTVLSPNFDLTLPHYTHGRTAEQKYLWESFIPLFRNQKLKEPLQTLTEGKN